MNTTIFVCPFALFGNPGTQDGAELLADAIREMLDDNEAERRRTRAAVYQKHVQLRELLLDTPDDLAGWQSEARAVAKSHLEAGEFLIWIGGNHLSVMPLYEELGGHAKSLVVQFDAHLDIYHHNDTKTELSHGNFIRFLPEPRPDIINVGHRDQFLTNSEIHKHFTAAIGAIALAQNGVEARLATAAKKAKRVCIDVDCDVLDPAYFPAVDDALPFGLNPQQLLRMMHAIWNEKVCAVSLSEFNPARDDNDRSLQLATWLIEQILLWRYES